MTRIRLCASNGIAVFYLSILVGVRKPLALKRWVNAPHNLAGVRDTSAWGCNVVGGNFAVSNRKYVAVVSFGRWGN